MKLSVISVFFIYMGVTVQAANAEAGRRAIHCDALMYQKNRNFCLYDGKSYSEGSTINPGVRLGLMQCVQKPSIRLTSIDGKPEKPAEYIWIPK